MYQSPGNSQWCRDAEAAEVKGRAVWGRQSEKKWWTLLLKDLLQPCPELYAASTRLHAGGTILFCMVLLLLLLLTRALFTVPALNQPWISLESALSQLGQLRVVAMRQFHLHPMPPVPNEEISTADGLLRANGADQAGPGNVRDSWEDAGHLRSIWMYLVWNSHSLAIQNIPELPLRSRFIPFLHVWRQMLQQPYKWGAMWIIYFPCSCHKWSEERSRKVINFNRHSKRRRISNQSNS